MSRCSLTLEGQRKDEDLSSAWSGGITHPQADESGIAERVNEQADTNDDLNWLCDEVETEGYGEVLSSAESTARLTRKDASAETIVVSRPFVISTRDFPDSRLTSACLDDPLTLTSSKSRR